MSRTRTRSERPRRDYREAFERESQADQTDADARFGNARALYFEYFLTFAKRSSVASWRRARKGSAL